MRDFRGARVVRGAWRVWCVARGAWRVARGACGAWRVARAWGPSPTPHLVPVFQQNLRAELAPLGVEAKSGRDRLGLFHTQVVR